MQKCLYALQVQIIKFSLETSVFLMAQQAVKLQLNIQMFLPLIIGPMSKRDIVMHYLGWVDDKFDEGPTAPHISVVASQMGVYVLQEQKHPSKFLNIG